MLPSLKYMDMVDGLPIVGHSDVRWFKTSKDTPYYGEWVGQCFEHDIGCDKYIEHKGRPAVYQWFKWTPGLVLSYTKMRWFQELITGHYKRETEINNTKIIGYKSLYDNLIPRKKYTGFEKIDPIINEFEEHLLFKNKGLIYRGDTKRTLNQMWMEITGKPYQFTIEVSDKYKISKEL